MLHLRAVKDLRVPSLHLSTAVVAVSWEQSASPIRELRPPSLPASFLGNTKGPRRIFAPTGGPRRGTKVRNDARDGTAHRKLGSAKDTTTEPLEIFGAPTGLGFR